MYYEKVFKTFKKNKVHYLIAGGIAVNLHGVPRYTQDLDILVDVRAANLKRLGVSLKELGYQPRVSDTLGEFLNKENWARWKKEKGMRAFTLVNPKVMFEEIDILTESPFSYSYAKRRQTKIRAGTLLLSVVSLNDLIRMKRKAGRLKDLSDIESLEKVRKVKRLL